MNHRRQLDPPAPRARSPYLRPDHVATATTAFARGIDGDLPSAAAALARIPRASRAALGAALDMLKTLLDDTDDYEANLGMAQASGFRLGDLVRCRPDTRSRHGKPDAILVRIDGLSDTPGHWRGVVVATDDARSDVDATPQPGHVVPDLAPRLLTLVERPGPARPVLDPH